MRLTGTLLIALTLTFTACKTKERVVAVETVRTDTLLCYSSIRDSVYLHDSIYVSERQTGDTVWVEVTRWRERIRETRSRDTIYQSRTDSVAVPYPVPEYVEKPLTWWQRARMMVGDVAMMMVAEAVALAAVRRRFLGR